MRTDTAIFSFGRFNPPTKGHERLIEFGLDLADHQCGDYFLFPSPSIDKRPKRKPFDPSTAKNPIPHATKVAILRRLYPAINIIEDTSVYSPQQVIEFLSSRGYTKLAFVVGSDRKEEFERRWLPYAADVLTEARVVSAGDRDPDADGVEGMSGSKARLAALNGDLRGFARAVGWQNHELTEELFDEVRKGMGLNSTQWQTESTNIR